MATTDAMQLPPKLKTHKQYTLVIPLDLQRDRVLLGYKLRGFGQGKYNGFGGKVEQGESIVAAAIRELHEESGLLVREPDMIQRGALLLETVADNSSPILEIHVFTVDKWEGTENATDEMHPTWFSLSESLTPTSATPAPIPTPNVISGSLPSSFLSTPPGTEAHDLPLALPLQPIPYHQMWEESRVWLPRLLQNLMPPDLVPQEQQEEQQQKKKRYFIHHVQFIGGVDRDVSSNGEYSVWHGMGERRLDWVDELPVGEWDSRRTFGRYP
ncbi:hypothetical protein TWF694_009666 [Orbilia ellipsospora]|uniref:Oxidized purine nucleoside triphosphate hydrolase n=1 Tax=Orbilia ellipsospora TaxID=2528407 RepID=A0AAV9XCR1_9PEZI